MVVKLAGKLPNETHSGLDRLQGVLVNHPTTRHVIIAIIDCASTKVDHGEDGDYYTPTAGVLFLEPITDREDVDALVEVLSRTRAERLDDDTLDFDFGLGDPLGEAVRKMRDAGVTISLHNDDD